MAEYFTPRTLTGLGAGLAFVYSGFSFGASALTIPLVQKLPAAEATAFFKPFFFTGAGLVVPMAIGSATAAAAGSYLLSGRSTPVAERVHGYSPVNLGYAAAVVVLLGLPWTRVVMMGTVNRLLVLAEDRAKSQAASSEVIDLLAAWQWMNQVRAGIAATAGLLGLASLAGQR